jgi:hypothetical protein
MFYQIEVLFKEPVENIGVFDADKFDKAMEVVKSKLSEEDYLQLKTEFNFDVHYYNVSEDSEGETE